MSRLPAASLLLGLVACGGGSSTPDAAKSIDAPKLIDSPVVTIDAAVDAFVNHADAAPAMGTMHHYVANKENVPQTNQQAKDEGLDLNGDGVVDNQLGMALAASASMGTGSTQTATDTAISHG